jgi:hypothetical protein
LRGLTVKGLMSGANRCRSEVFFALVFLLFTLFIFRGYFEHTNILGTDSMGLPFIITSSHLSNDFFSTWISYSGLGFPDYPLPIYQTLYLAATALGISPLDIAKALLIVAFWLAGVSMFVCAKRLTGHNIPSVAAALVFCFNQVLLSQVIDGHYYFVLSYALFPFVFLIFHSILKGCRTKYDPLIPVVLVAYGTLATPNIVIISILFLGIFALSKWRLEQFPAKRLAMTIALIVLIMAFFGLSVLLANNNPTYNTSYPIQEAMRWSSPSMMDSLTLKASENSFFFGNETSAWVQPDSLTILADTTAFMVPILAFAALLWKEHHRSTLPLAIIAALFIFLAKGPYEPLSVVFEWGFNNIPILDTIRVFSRFSLLTSFCFGLLIAYFIIGLEARLSLPTSQKSLRSVLSRHRRKAIISLVVALGACLLFQSGAVLTGAVGTFDLPNEYQAPFDWVGEQDGDFRILNLPYMADYHNAPSTYGYPNTTTIDPGIYSMMYTGKDTVYGSSTYDFWSFFDHIIEVRSFGYKEIPSILGATASMRYIVVQTHTSAEELSAFMSMNGLTVAAQLDGGGMVLENNNWSPRVSAYSNISLVTGGRNMLTSLAGMGLYEPDAEGLVFLDQLTTTDAEQLLDIADRIYISNGDLTELYMELSDWSSEQSVMLSSLGTSHTTDDVSNWIQSKWPLKAGLTLNPTLFTTGRCSVTVTMESEGAGSRMFLKLMRGPDAGNLSISIPGMAVQTYDASYPVHQMAWIELQVPDQPGSVDITITNEGDGQNNLERLVMVAEDEMDAQMERVDLLLSDHLEKLVYVYPASSYFGEGRQLIGDEGTGVMTTEAGGPFNIIIGDLIAGQQRALVLQMNVTDQAVVTVGGVRANSTISSLDGAVYDLGQLSNGDEIGITTNGTYGVALFSGDWVENAPSEVDVGYEHPRSELYRVNIDGDGPLVIQVSENFNSWWSGRAGAESLLHLPINSVINGYLIYDGNSTVYIEYQGGVAYTIILVLLVIILLATASLIMFKRYKTWNKDTNG